MSITAKRLRSADSGTQDNTTYGNTPLISIMAFGEGGDLIASLDRQSYPFFTYTDADISAAWSAPGSYLMFLPNDSALFPNALLQIASACAGADFVYTDEDTLLYDGSHTNPVYKPDFAPETLLSCPYIGLAFAVSSAWFRRFATREMLRDPSLTALTLFAALSAERVRHIPRVLLSRKSRLPLLDGSPVACALRCLGRDAIVSDGLFPGSFRVRHAYRPHTRITVAVWNRGEYSVWKRTLETIEQASVFDGYDLLIIDTAPDTPQLARYRKDLARNRAARVHRLPPDTPPPGVWNAAVSLAQTPYILFLDAAYAPEGYDDIECLLEQCTVPGVGAVGGRLDDGEGALLSCGYTVGLLGGVASPYRDTRPAGDDPLRYRFVDMIRNVSALPACGMLVSRDAFAAAGGFDISMPQGYDAAFGLQLAAQGFRCVYTPYAAFRRHAVDRRDPPLTPENEMRLKDVFRDMLQEGDPYFNPNWDYGSVCIRAADTPAPAAALHRSGIWFFEDGSSGEGT